MATEERSNSWDRGQDSAGELLKHFHYCNLSYVNSK